MMDGGKVEKERGTREGRQEISTLLIATIGFICINSLFQEGTCCMSMKRTSMQEVQPSISLIRKYT